MRVFISSTPGELEPYRQVAAGIARELGHEPVLGDPAPRRGLDPVTACDRRVALADLLVAIVGWRRGRVPPAEDGGDGLRPWSYWQVRSAFERGVPVVALLAGEHLAFALPEEDPEARAVIANLRGELARIASVFDGETDFRDRLHSRLREAERITATPATAPAGPRLRLFPPPELPPRPYPLLLPYSHPQLMAGRDSDLAGLRRILGRPLTAVGLHAASGMGKSSLLAGGLVPALCAEGRPVAFIRHPAEAGLARRLLGDLVEIAGGDPLEIGAGIEIDGGGARSFVDWLATARRLAGGAPPVLVIDQLEDLFRAGGEADRATRGRAALGMLLAASAQRLPGAGDPVCRWLLAYRQETHGRLVEWLEDVLRDARRLGFEAIGELPHDLSLPSRFAARALRPLAAPPPASDDPAAAAARVFLEAIEKPLRVRPRDAGQGEGGIFPWTFAPGHAERLARAFGEARVRRPGAPLVPELQVVLAHLLERAGEPAGGDAAGPSGPRGRDVVVEVPADPGGLIDRALEEHLRRGLDSAFPRGLDATGDEAASVGRTRALLVLRELAGSHGRRQQGRAAGALAAALGEQGRDVLEKLSTPRTRLVLLEQRAGSWVYVLAHDRLAEVLVEVVDEGSWAGLGVDAELLELRRFVTLQSQLFASGDAAQATAVPPARLRGIEAQREVLLWTEPQRAWWRACRARRRLERRRALARRVVAAVVAVAVTLGAWTLADRRARRRALLAEVVAGEPEAAFAALDRLSLDRRPDSAELIERLRERPEPFDVFERGLGGVGVERRAGALLRVAELALPILEESFEDPVLIASLVWALDLFAARDPASAEGAAALRDEVLGPLRRSRPPLLAPALGDPNWADVPAGTVWLEAGGGAAGGQARRRVTLSAFRMMTHEVTNAEYRRFEPEHDASAGAGLPARRVNWYRAYAYAAWLGGRLPTEAEWQYAARAGCGHAFCRRDGSQASLGEVAWWVGNATDPETGESAPRPIMGLEPNPWGLWDLYGNLWEWSATWSGAYPQASGRDPPGPTASALGHRVVCGGAAWSLGEWLMANRRIGNPPSQTPGTSGFRVVITAEAESATRKPR